MSHLSAEEVANDLAISQQIADAHPPAIVKHLLEVAHAPHQRRQRPDDGKPPTWQGVYVASRSRVAKKLSHIQRHGHSHLHIISDFDMTMTAYTHPVTGTRSHSSHGILTNSSVVSADFREKTMELYHRYYPMEISQTMAMPDKVRAMEEWWHQAHALLLTQHIKRRDITRMVVDTPVVWRSGIATLLQTCCAATPTPIPVLVFSAGVGDVIKEVLIQAGFYSEPWMHIVSNEMIFAPADSVVIGADGVAVVANSAEQKEKLHKQYQQHQKLSETEHGDDICVRFKEPVIHVFNKNEFSLKHQRSATEIVVIPPVSATNTAHGTSSASVGSASASVGASSHAQSSSGRRHSPRQQLYIDMISERKNVLLLGDSVGDLRMADGMRHDVCLTVGFLNHDVDALLEKYMNAFDVVIAGDGPLDWVNALLSHLVTGDH